MNTRILILLPLPSDPDDWQLSTDSFQDCRCSPGALCRGCPLDEHLESCSPPPQQTQAEKGTAQLPPPALYP